MRLGRALLGTLYVTAGTLHFLFTRQYQRIMPGYLPAHRTLVLLSGAAEIVGGLGILAPQTSITPQGMPGTSPATARPTSLEAQPGRAAAWGLIALLLAVFPANLTMITENARFPGVPLWAAWARLPLQLPLLWWAWLYTRREAWLPPRP